MDFCKRMRDLRIDHDMTQADVAVLLGTTKQQVSKWENGTQMMGVDKYVKLAMHYNISVDYLLGLINTPRKLWEE